MPRKSKQQEDIFTPSGHQVDKDLMKVSVKVSPSLQALIANQIDLLEMLEGKAAKNPVLVEQHRVEVLQVEEEIANAYAKHIQKREKAREQRLKKKQLMNCAHPAPVGEGTGKQLGEEQSGEERPGEERPIRPPGETAVPFDIIDEPEPTGGKPLEDEPAWGEKITKEAVTGADTRPLEYDMHFDVESSGQGAGLPSSRYVNTVRPAAAKNSDMDIRRVALGASIKALQSFLGRELKEEEIKFLEIQVDNNLQ